VSREIHIAIIEDSKGTHHQFDAPTEIELTGKIAGWVRKKWKKAWGDQPDDADDTVNEFFQKYALPPFVNPGWECELWRAEPVVIDSAPAGPHSPGPWSQDPEGEVACTIEDANGKQVCYVHIDRNAEGEITEESEANVNLIESAPMMHAALNRKGPGQAPGFTYPMELYINGELSFRLDTEDATGDLAAIKALMKWRTARRDNRPLTDMELYGTDRPHDVIYRSANGKTRVVPMSASPAAVRQVWELPVNEIKVKLEAQVSSPDGCTFKKGDKDPCPTCPKLITCLHSCGLLQDELHEAHGTGHAEPGGED
jgi:hypothetical protein